MHVSLPTLRVQAVPHVDLTVFASSTEAEKPTSSPDQCSTSISRCSKILRDSLRGAGICPNSWEARFRVGSLVMGNNGKECVVEALGHLKAKASALAALMQEYDELNMHEARKTLLSSEDHPFCVSSTRVSPSLNANFIEPPSSFAFGPRVICSAQPHSEIDFWEMIVQNECRAIVKLTEDAGAMYFPSEEGESKTFGKIKVTNHTKTTSRFGVVKRVFSVECSVNGVHTVEHFQVSWSDFGVPRKLEPIQEIIAALSNIQSGSYVVHCRAGIGRAGTFVTIDHILRRVLGGDLSAADVPKTLQYLREKRRSLVETREQYLFVYTAVISLLEACLASSTEMNAQAQQYEEDVRYADAFEV